MEHQEYRFPIQIYYEDTDLSGVVYHANYIKYFERAREHVIGAEKLVELLDAGIGFTVYKVAVTYKEGARLGDIVEVRSTYVRESKFRVVFQQNVYRDDTLLVEGSVEMVCVDESQSLVPLPTW